MNRRDAIRRVAAIGATLALPAVAQANRIVLGQSAAMTGPAAQLGLQMNAGARIFFNTLNAQGGVNGNAVELRVADDGYEPDRCKANTDKFIRDDVFGLFGYIGTPTCLAALPLVVDSKIPFFGPFTGAEALRDPFHKSVFHLRASYYDETALIVKQLTSGPTVYGFGDNVLPTVHVSDLATFIRQVALTLPQQQHLLAVDDGRCTHLALVEVLFTPSYFSSRCAMV